MNRKTIGILGGMGPEATASLYQKIIRHTSATTDQQHLHVIIDADPSVPDRTKAILQNGASPTRALKEMALRLKKSGADVLILPCNTAHFFIDEVLQSVDLPFINMIDETVRVCQAVLPERSCVGLLATSGTLAANVYHARFLTTNLNLLVPEDEDQLKLMEGIYNGVKAGQLEYGADLLKEVAQNLIKKGAQLIIGGCTEIPLAINDKDLEVPFVDTLDVLAAAVVAYAQGMNTAGMVGSAASGYGL